jgi:glutathione synthase/RimK-type ligase-like ATP-grasp enzyme
MNRRCCFLSMDSLVGYVSDDELAIPFLKELGWQVETISWSDPTADWNSYDAAIIRTTWDYQKRPERYLEVLADIETSGARLMNPLSVVKWNLDKRYLRELEISGVRIVPTIWKDGGISSKEFSEWQSALGSELIIKPTVSATAHDTFRLSDYDRALEPVFYRRSFMVQPFVPAIVDEGEYSLFYFAGEYSHTILKSPVPGDFRVQEEYGGVITAAEPEPRLITTAAAVLSNVPDELLYARIDLVRDARGGFMLMELELIEPALYFRMDADAPARFASAFDRMMNEL